MSRYYRTLLNPPPPFPYPESGLVSYWKLDEDPAEHNTVIVDSRGSTNGTLITNDGSTNKSVTGQVGKAIDFDGTDDYIDVSSLTLSEYTEITISFWMLCVQTSDRVGAVQGWGPLSSDQTVLIRGDNGTIQFFTRTVNGQAGGNITSYSANTWEHYAFVYDGVDMLAYRNGVKSATEYPQTGAFQTLSDTYLSIGGQSGASSEFFHDGLMDDVLIYNRALSLSEIQQIYNNSL